MPVCDGGEGVGLDLEVPAEQHGGQGHELLVAVILGAPTQEKQIVLSFKINI